MVLESLVNSSYGTANDRKISMQFFFNFDQRQASNSQHTSPVKITKNQRNESDIKILPSQNFNNVSNSV